MIRLLMFMALWSFPRSCDSADLEIYWNVPSQKCQRFHINFKDVHEKFGLIQNVDDKWTGDQIVMFDRLGRYPYLEFDSNNSSTEINGGVPQKAELEAHLQSIPRLMKFAVDPNFAGLGFIRYVDWRPIYYQNLGSNHAYQRISYGLTDDTLSPVMRENAALMKFEQHARIFMEETLKLVKTLRPKARWSYLDYPRCFYTVTESNSSYSHQDINDDDRLSWLWKLEDFIMPLIRIDTPPSNVSSFNYADTTINEVKRIVNEHNANAEIIPQLKLIINSTSGEFTKKDDIAAILKRMSDRGIERIFIWEDSRDLNSRDKCNNYRNYLNDVLGPVVKDTLKHTPDVTGSPVSNNIVTAEIHQDQNFLLMYQPVNLILIFLAMCYLGFLSVTYFMA